MIEQHFDKRKLEGTKSNCVRQTVLPFPLPAPETASLKKNLCRTSDRVETKRSKKEWQKKGAYRERFRLLASHGSVKKIQFFFKYYAW